MTDTISMPQLAPGAIRKRNVFDVLEVLKSKDTFASKKPNILVRVDFNVPTKDNGDGTLTITDDSRIRGALPTIRAITQGVHCNAILVSHMGRPKLVQKSASADTDDAETAKQRRDLSLEPVADHLSKLMNTTVLFGADCMNAQDTVNQLPASGGGICLLENLRFYKQEEKNDKEFATKLASYADAYVNDAFGTCHRAHASVSGVPEQMPSELCGIGCLVASELAFLDFSNVGPQDKVAAIIGGSKVSTKLPVIKGILGSAQVLVLGGGLAFTFLKAKGVNIGNSLVEEDLVDTAKDLLQQAEEQGKTIIIPVDSVCSQEFPKAPMELTDTKTFEMTVEAGGIPDGWMGLDAGPQTLALIREALTGSSKLVCNGPLGVFEVPPFDQGTRGLVQIMADLTKQGTVTVVGGGDSVAALEAFGETQAVSYVSTGGGATLELLAGDILPGVAAIADYQA